ncbi:MAG: hypothetical protein LIP02_03995 [Bacteroidales bacterium]|nr:hypothetical protein [Bacteroidales bacterium]
MSYIDEIPQEIRHLFGENPLPKGLDLLENDEARRSPQPARKTANKGEKPHKWLKPTKRQIVDYCNNHGCKLRDYSGFLTTFYPEDQTSIIAEVTAILNGNDILDGFFSGANPSIWLKYLRKIPDTED